MVNGIRASDPRRLNKGRGSKFRVSPRVRQETEENEHLRKSGGYIGQNVVNITIKMERIIRKP